MPSVIPPNGISHSTDNIRTPLIFPYAWSRACGGARAPRRRTSADHEAQKRRREAVFARRTADRRVHEERALSPTESVRRRSGSAARRLDAVDDAEPFFSTGRMPPTCTMLVCGGSAPMRSASLTAVPRTRSNSDEMRTAIGSGRGPAQSQKTPIPGTSIDLPRTASGPLIRISNARTTNVQGRLRPTRTSARMALPRRKRPAGRTAAPNAWRMPPAHLRSGHIEASVYSTPSSAMCSPSHHA